MATRKTNPQSSNPTIEVALYGTTDMNVGAGYIVRISDGRMAGDGTPIAHRTFTEALWIALDKADELIGRPSAGRERYQVAVHFQRGDHPLMARTTLAYPRPTFGDLKWEAGPVYTIDAETLIKAAECAHGDSRPVVDCPRCGAKGIARCACFGEVKCPAHAEGGAR